MDPNAWPQREIQLPGVRLHAVDVGKGPLVVLLHGFPDFSYSWRRQIPALVEAGYRVVAPDMRGYNQSEKPTSVDDYRIDLLAGDVSALITACGAARAAAVVGHDWGGAVAWAVASRHPDQVERLVILNCPHPVTFAAALTSARQLLRSWYMVFFQLPWLPERLLQARGAAALRRALRWGATDEASFSDDDLRRYADAFSQPGAVRGGINYYRAMARAMLRRRGRMPSAARGGADIPILVMWGEQDPVLLPALAQPPADLAPLAAVIRLPEAGHWVHLDASEQVNAALVTFLAE